MILRLLKLGLSLGLVALVLGFADAGAVAERLRQADLGWLAVSALGVTAVTFLMARRWQLVAESLSLDLPYRQALREYYLSSLINQVVPGGIVGDAARAFRLRTAGDLKRAALSVVFERALGQIALFGLTGLGFAVALLTPSGIAWPTWAWAVPVALLAVAILGAVLQAPFLQDLRRLVRMPAQIALSLAISILLALSLLSAARAVATDLPAEALFTLIPLVLSAMLIPLSVGGWGWREGAAAALFPLAGVTAEAGIATGIAYGAVLMVAALPAAFCLTRPRGIKTGTATP